MLQSKDTGTQDGVNDAEEDAEVAELLEKKEKLLQTLQEKQVHSDKPCHSLNIVSASAAGTLL